MSGKQVIELLWRSAVERGDTKLSLERWTDKSEIEANTIKVIEEIINRDKNGMDKVRDIDLYNRLVIFDFKDRVWAWRNNEEEALREAKEKILVNRTSWIARWKLCVKHKKTTKGLKEWLINDIKGSGVLTMDGNVYKLPNGIIYFLINRTEKTTDEWFNQYFGNDNPQPADLSSTDEKKDIEEDENSVDCLVF